MGASQVIPANEYRRERWKNGAGWTREIVAVCACAFAGKPGCAGSCVGVAWRLSIAEIERDAPFSRFDGIDRELVLLSGNGLRLRFDDGKLHTLLPPHGRLRFAGERALGGELVDGPTQDFNLMWRRDTVDAQLWHRPLVGPMVVFVEPGATWALHLLAGHAHFADGSGLSSLAAGDTALLCADAARQRYLLEGAGELLAIRLQPCQSELRAATVG